MVSSSVVVPKSGLYAEPRADWLALYREDIIDPARRIIDAHHHLWDRQGGRYLLEELTDDIAIGPQHRRDRLCRLPFDVPRRRTGSVQAGR